VTADRVLPLQQVLFLWLDKPELRSTVLAWSFYDGANPDSDVEDLPYRSGLDAMADGWRMLAGPVAGEQAKKPDLHASHLPHQFTFERYPATPDRGVQRG
jgi:hypothetical protein